MNASRGGGADDRYAQIEATRRGAHRARPTPLASLAPVVAVVSVVLVVLVGLWAVAGGFGGGDGGDSASEAGGASPTQRSERTTRAQAPEETAPPDSPAADPPETAEVDRLSPVNVLNNTGTAGLAKTAADRLEAAGWRIGDVGNHRPPGSVPVTSVFYAGAEQAATAKAVAGDVGATEVKRSPGLAASGVTVILATDFQQ